MLLTMHPCKPPIPRTPTSGPRDFSITICYLKQQCQSGKAGRSASCRAGGTTTSSKQPPTTSDPLAALASLCSEPLQFSRRAGSSTRVVPLLGAQQGVPFTVSLEVVGHEEGEAPNFPSQSPLDVDQGVLELVYVLSGNGVLSGWSTVDTSSSSSSTHGVDGTATRLSPTWALRPGVSALSWANSTCISATHQLEQQAPRDEPQQQQQQLALLKFLIPLALLDPASDAYGDTEAARSVLQGLGCTLHDQEMVQGVLDRAEAAQLLSHAHSRARGVFNMYPVTGQLPPNNSHNGDSASSATPISNNSTNNSNNSNNSSSSISSDSTLTLTLITPSSSQPSTSSTANSSSSSSSGVASSSSSIPIISKGYGNDAATTLSVSCNGEEPALVPSHTKEQGEETGSHTQGAVANGHHHHASSNSSSGSANGSGSSDEGSGSDRGGSFVSSPAPAFDFEAGLMGRPASESVLLRRAMEEWGAYQFPNQQNRLALAFDPTLLSGLSLSFGVEVFTPGHVTPLHTHSIGHEMFFVLAGKGDAWCDGHHIPVAAGDCIVFPPGTLHGLDNPSPKEKMYTLQMMVPDDSFVAFVQSGESLGSLDDEDICTLTAFRC